VEDVQQPVEQVAVIIVVHHQVLHVAAWPALWSSALRMQIITTPRSPMVSLARW